jgi:hypothetical protein
MRALWPTNSKLSWDVCVCVAKLLGDHEALPWEETDKTRRSGSISTAGWLRAGNIYQKANGLGLAALSRAGAGALGPALRNERAAVFLRVASTSPALRYNAKKRRKARFIFESDYAKSFKSMKRAKSEKGTLAASHPFARYGFEPAAKHAKTSEDPIKQAKPSKAAAKKAKPSKAAAKKAKPSKTAAKKAKPSKAAAKASKAAGKKSKAKEQWIVRETQYPTEHGCHRGRSWTRADLIQMSDVCRHGPYTTYKAALSNAKRLCEKSCRFDEEVCSTSNFDANGPWDSAAFENWDNDEEVRFEILTQEACEQEATEDKAHLAMARSEDVFQHRLKETMTQTQVEQLGRVHYSHPSQPWDIRADLEVVVEEGKVKETWPQSNLGKCVNGVPKTMYFKQGRPNCSKTQSDVEKKKGQEVVEVDALAAVVAKYKHSLQEIHLDLDSLGEDRVQKLIAAAPQLSTRLKLLRVCHADMAPEAIAALVHFTALERLDISNCVSSGYFDGCGGYDSNGDAPHPYDGALLAVTAAMPKLQQLDLGYGDDSMTRYFWDYCVSNNAMEQVPPIEHPLPSSSLTTISTSPPSPPSPPSRVLPIPFTGAAHPARFTAHDGGVKLAPPTRYIRAAGERQCCSEATLHSI